MKIYVIYLTSRIRWLLHKSDPVEFSIKSRNMSFKVVSPLLYTDISVRYPKIHLENPLVIPTSSYYLLTSDRLVVRFEDHADHTKDNLESLLLDISFLLKSLRHFSWQASISPYANVTCVFNHEIESLPDLTINYETIKGAFREYFIITSVTADHLLKAENCIYSTNIETYETVLLDAILSHDNSDYQKSLLYSAMSLEIFISTTLQKKYDELIQTHPKEYRFISSQSHDGIHIHDPIYKILSESDDFSRFLHHTTLYIYQKSLLQDNQKLYNNAKKLYKTRNKIVHTGIIPNDPNSFLLPTKEDSIVALETVKDTMKWYGYEQNIILPSLSFINVS